MHVAGLASGARIMHEGYCEHTSEPPPRWLQVRASDRDTAVVVAWNSADAARAPAASQQATAAAPADVAAVDAAAAELDACTLIEGREESAAAGEDHRASPSAATAAAPSTSPTADHPAQAAAGVVGTATACSTALATVGRIAGCSGGGSSGGLDSDAGSGRHSNPHGGRGGQSGGSRAVVRRNGGRWARGPLPRALWKYWLQRYTLFSRFDEGVLIDEEGWFSVTPEALARWLPAEKLHTTLG